MTEKTIDKNFKNKKNIEHKKNRHEYIREMLKNRQAIKPKTPYLVGFTYNGKK